MSDKFIQLCEALETEHTLPIQTAETAQTTEVGHVQEVEEDGEEYDNCQIHFEATDEDTKFSVCCEFEDESTEECKLIVTMCEIENEDSCLCLSLSQEEVQQLCNTLQEILEQQKTEKDITVTETDEKSSTKV